MSEEKLDQGIICFKAGRYEDAKICWEEAANRGNASAMFCLGLLYLHENYRNPQVAKEWFVRAEEAGHKNARKQLLLMANDDYGYINDYFSLTNNTDALLDFPMLAFGNREWIVIKEEEGKKLCLSRDIIDIRSFNRDKHNNQWESSDIRNWLNSDYLNTFNDMDRARIIECEVKNNPNPVYGTDAGKDTWDMFFLLSLMELVDAFNLDLRTYDDDNLISTDIRKPELIAYVNICEERLLELSLQSDIDYRMAQGQSIGWWLRTPGASEERVMRVNCHGVVRIHGRDVNRQLVGVRPAMWLGE